MFIGFPIPRKPVHRFSYPDAIAISRKFPSSMATMSYDAIKNYADPSSGLSPDLQNTIKEIAEETVASPVVNDAATIVDLSYDVAIYAQEQQKTSALSKIQSVQKKAEAQLTEEMAINRFTDYHIATSNILSCQTSLGALAEQIDKPGASQFTAKVKWVFKRIKESFTAGVSRLYKGLVGIKDYVSEQIQDIVNNLDDWLKNKVDSLLEKIHGIINSMSNFFSNALIGMIRWPATIKKIASQNDFALKSVKVSIEPAEVKTLPIPGFPIPYLTFKMPTIDFEFGQKE